MFEGPIRKYVTIGKVRARSRRMFKFDSGAYVFMYYDWHYRGWKGEAKILIYKKWIATGFVWADTKRKLVQRIRREAAETANPKLVEIRNRMEDGSDWPAMKRWQ